MARAMASSSTGTAARPPPWRVSTISVYFPLCPISTWSMQVGSLFRQASPRVMGTLSSSHSEPQTPPVSSSPTRVSVSCPRIGASSSWSRTSDSREATDPAFMSPTPRPRMRPSMHSPE